MYNLEMYDATNNRNYHAKKGTFDTATNECIHFTQQNPNRSARILNSDMKAMCVYRGTEKGYIFELAGL